MSDITTAPTPSHGKHYLSLDIEMRGVDMEDNPVTAIGVYVAPVKQAAGDAPALVIKRRWALQPLPGQVDEERCVKEFWNNFPIVDQWIKDNARPVQEVMLAFRAFLRELVATLGTRNIIILTDCPDTCGFFDLARLDWLGKRTGTFTQPIRYLDVGVRHSQCDPSERLDQLGDKATERFEAWLAQHHPGVKHTHFPDEDAEHSYWMQVYCDEQRPKE